MAILFKSYHVAKFDRKYGVDTSGIIHPSDLDIPYRNRQYGNSYEPVGLIDFQEIYRDLNIPYEEFTFIDLGSGKGLACLLASALPFRKIIGVEYSRELNDVAKDNLRIFPKEEQRCQDHELICMDASKFYFPDDPFVLFLYNPFELPVMLQVVNNVSASYGNQPRRIVVTYFTPVHDRLWDTVTFLKRVIVNRKYTIWDTGPVNRKSAVPEISIRV